MRPPGVRSPAAGCMQNALQLSASQLPCLCQGHSTRRTLEKSPSEPLLTNTRTTFATTILRPRLRERRVMPARVRASLGCTIHLHKAEDDSNLGALEQLAGVLEYSRHGVACIMALRDVYHAAGRSGCAHRAILIRGWRSQITTFFIRLRLDQSPSASQANEYERNDQ